MVRVLGVTGVGEGVAVTGTLTIWVCTCTWVTDWVCGTSTVTGTCTGVGAAWQAPSSRPANSRPAINTPVRLWGMCLLLNDSPPTSHRNNTFGRGQRSKYAWAGPNVGGQP